MLYPKNISYTSETADRLVGLFGSSLVDGPLANAVFFLDLPIFSYKWPSKLSKAVRFQMLLHLTSKFMNFLLSELLKQFVSII